MGLYSGGRIIGRILASEIWGAFFREGLLFFFWAGAYYRNFTVDTIRIVRLGGDREGGRQRRLSNTTNGQLP